MRLKLRLKLFLKRTRETNKGNLLIWNYSKMKQDSIGVSEIALLVGVCMMIYFKYAETSSKVTPMRFYDHDYNQRDDSYELLRMNNSRYYDTIRSHPNE